MERLREWYDSPEYAPLKRLHEEVADSQLVVVEGQSAGERSENRHYRKPDYRPQQQRSDDRRAVVVVAMVGRVGEARC